MRRRPASLLMVPLAMVLLAASVVGCASSPSPSSEPSAAPLSVASSEPQEVALPDLRGRGLQEAENMARDAGFMNVIPHDALGRGREPVLARDWAVCDQVPQPGTTVSTAAPVELGVVKLDEACPAADAAPEALPTVGATMPDLVGLSLKLAREILGPAAKLTLVDATGENRPVLVPTSWKVCSSSPRPGQPYSADTQVTLGLVEFEEECPARP